MTQVRWCVRPTSDLTAGASMFNRIWNRGDGLCRRIHYLLCTNQPGYCSNYLLMCKLLRRLAIRQSSTFMISVSFSVLTLLARWREVHLAPKKPAPLCTCKFSGMSGKKKTEGNQITQVRLENGGQNKEEEHLRSHHQLHFNSGNRVHHNKHRDRLARPGLALLTEKR